ncbi:hypothetical protein C9374_002172 [Naegleria lovaniensis]|uniref:Raptor N-terminal CASPase-like domain-containing protein n=1 Tax=Naegleria lovaniensis TaxID=51637 RepID=A0AA88GU89_NAELO|nr:uncharacterized protein C9374_002172 [Naegleria lovaniensis]KAG2387137.1 hypothetical protein C9374_002172 [Naegleria lovaniensis]
MITNDYDENPRRRPTEEDDDEDDNDPQQQNGGDYDETGGFDDGPKYHNNSNRMLGQRSNSTMMGGDYYDDSGFSPAVGQQHSNPTNIMNNVSPSSTSSVSPPYGGQGSSGGSSDRLASFRLTKSRRRKSANMVERPVFFTSERHQPFVPVPKEVIDWRMKQRLKTVHVALVVCLNIGVDPPDVVKVHPCAKYECWVDPQAHPQKALEGIGANLKMQYERWQPRARYKQCLDPTVEDVKKTCVQLRKSAKKERILFHYNGHGVPKPTTNGEIWVFNKTFTQYIPLSLYDLYCWMDSPSIYVFDCSNAGIILNSFIQIIEQKDVPPRGSMMRKENIILAACGVNENLPMNPDFPADLFTSCLTTPIKIALNWFMQRNKLVDGVTEELIDNIPGRINDRRTPIGELNWIFTAVTDTIAWNVLPRDLFHKLFRQDLLVASLFRNFLLADRIMRSANCTPVSYPKLPETHNHPMWDAWDLALDQCVSQLPNLLNNPNAEYQYSPFFSSQLTDFQVWLDFGHRIQKPPTQLPILLQVLLSQSHRLRALTLLGRFLDMGSWAVNLALSVGIFPYVLKLLQSNSLELRRILVFIWTKILALDRPCQVDLVKDHGHSYFINILVERNNDSELRAMACFVLSVIADRFIPGQQACLKYKNLFDVCAAQLIEQDSLLRKWACLLIAKLLEDFDEAQEVAIKVGTHDKILHLLNDDVPEVRAACVFTLQKFIGLKPEKTEERIQGEIKIGTALYQVILDGSPLVRKELVYALGTLIQQYGEYIAPELLKSIIREETHHLTSAPTPILVSGSNPQNPSTPSTLIFQQKKKKKKDRKTLEADLNSQTPTPKDSKVLKDMKDRELGTLSYFVLDVCRVVIMLCFDPVREVAEEAHKILSFMKYSFTKLNDDEFERELFLIKEKAFNAQSVPKSPSLKPMPKRLMDKLSIRKSASDSDFLKAGYAQQQNNYSDDDTDSDSMDATSASTHQLVFMKSSFYERSCEYFSNPILPENVTKDDFVSPQTLKRRKRNEHLVKEASTMLKLVGKRKLEEQIGFFGNETEIVSQMKFHGFEPYLVVSDENDGLTIWNWVRGAIVNQFKCGDILKSRITDFHIINEESEQSMLLVASAAGNVAIYKNYEKKEEPVSSFRAAHEAIANESGLGILTEWQQHNGTLFVTGDIEKVKIWDVEKELCVQNLQLDSPVTSITSDPNNGFLFATGCTNGKILIFDKRESSSSPILSHQLISHYEECHKNWVVSTKIQNVNSYQVISGCANGDIMFWDTRVTNKCVKQFNAHKGSMTALAIHNYAPVLACGSNNQFIKVFNTSAETLSMIYYHDGFLGQRIGPISCLAFHPFRMCLAAGSTDSIISLYSSQEKP